MGFAFLKKKKFLFCSAVIFFKFFCVIPQGAGSFARPHPTRVPAGRARVQTVVLSAGTLGQSHFFNLLVLLQPHWNFATLHHSCSQPQTSVARITAAWTTSRSASARGLTCCCKYSRWGTGLLCRALFPNASDPTAIPGAGVVSSVGGQPWGRPHCLAPGENPPVQHAVPGQQRLLSLRATAALVAQRSLPGREDQGVGQR